jgi:photosynthetic reaction center H subunit
MEKGSIVGSIDVAQVVLYTFWVFFVGLIIYLRREDKREGYPLVSDRRGGVSVVGYPKPPAPKTFRLAHGGTVSAPSGRSEPAVSKARPTNPWPGAPLEPTGNPMLDAVGPAAYAQRADVPDLTIEGHDKIVPMRIATDFAIAVEDPDLRGMSVVAADRKKAGVVRDVWVDRSEVVIRYLEVEIAGGKRVLLPWNFSRIDKRRGEVNVKSILARQFADVPGTKSADRITLLEEDRIVAYYGGGHLYATPARTEPLL